MGTSTDAVGWGGWAWDMVSSVLPVDWDNNWSAEQQMAYSGHIIHLGVYIDDATLTFKVMNIIYPSEKTFPLPTILEINDYISIIFTDCRKRQRTVILQIPKN